MAVPADANKSSFIRSAAGDRPFPRQHHYAFPARQGARQSAWRVGTNNQPLGAQKPMNKMFLVFGFSGHRQMSASESEIRDRFFLQQSRVAQSAFDRLID